MTEYTRVLPTPIGKYVVGITHMEFEYTGYENELRRIPLTIFYPADSTEGKESAPYAFSEVAANVNVQKAFQETKTHCYPNVAVSVKQASYPVIFFNMGYGGHEMQSTVLCSDLASSGYLVASIGHPGEASVVRYQDNSVVPIKPEYLAWMSSDELFRTIMPLFEEFKTVDENDDARLVDMGRQFYALQGMINGRVKVWVLDSIRTADFIEKVNSGEIPSIFECKLSVENGIGLTGHSFGGNTAIQALYEESRFVCGINCDGGHFGETYGVDICKPLLSIGNPYIWKMLKAVFLDNSADAFHVTIDETDHLGFSDTLFLAVEPGEKERIGTRDPQNLRQVLTAYHLAFYEKYLLKSNLEFGDLGYAGTRFYEKRAA